MAKNTNTWQTIINGESREIGGDFEAYSNRWRIWRQHERQYAASHPDLVGLVESRLVDPDGPDYGGLRMVRMAYGLLYENKKESNAVKA